MAGTQKRAKSAGRVLVEYALTLLIAFALVFGVVKPFIVAAYRIPSGSMIPTLKIHDRVFANKFIYRFTDPERGDIAIFESPEGGPDPLIKRVIGLPGDRIELRDGVVFLNGERQSEPYVKRKACIRLAPKTCSFGPVTVPEDSVFMMGDNRAYSHDSRFFGAVPEEDFFGEAFAVFWPLDHAQWLL